jgi:hypothetical protein
MAWGAGVVRWCSIVASRTLLSAIIAIIKIKYSCISFASLTAVRTCITQTTRRTARLASQGGQLRIKPIETGYITYSLIGILIVGLMWRYTGIDPALAAI